ncbi:MAG: hypothetical protein EBX40_06885 [Gammaproteobacteria bacterium]|nr:hypothetical protein [Gammaproteobacteria bacterium]
MAHRIAKLCVEGRGHPYKNVVGHPMPRFSGAVPPRFHGRRQWMHSVFQASRTGNLIWLWPRSSGQLH